MRVQLVMRIVDDTLAIPSAWRFRSVTTLQRYCARARLRFGRPLAFNSAAEG